MRKFVWVNIYKFIGIIFVILGHANLSTSHYIYWFHMPMFFILSGMLINTYSNPFDYTKKKISSFYNNHIIYSTIIVFFLVLFLQSKLSLFSILRLLIPSAKLAGAFGVYWFPGILLVIQIIYTLFRKKFDDKILFTLSILLYAVNFYTITLFGNKFQFPFALELFPLSFYYFMIGRILSTEPLQKFIDHKNAIIVTLLSILTIFIANKYSFVLNIKNNLNSSFFLGALVPVVISIFFILISKKIADKFENTKILFLPNYIGSNTLSIMYLHQTIAIILRNKYNIYSVSIFLILSLTLPLLIDKLIALIKNRIICFNSKS